MSVQLSDVTLTAVGAAFISEYQGGASARLMIDPNTPTSVKLMKLFQDVATVVDILDAHGEANDEHLRTMFVRALITLSANAAAWAEVTDAPNVTAEMLKYAEGREPIPADQFEAQQGNTL